MNLLDIDEIELDFVGLIETALPRFRAVAFPEDVSAYLENNRAKCDGVALVSWVSFDSTSFSESQDSFIYTVEVQLVTKDLRSSVASQHSPAYDAMKLAVNAVNNQRLQYESQNFRAKVIRGGFVSHSQQNWIYAFRAQLIPIGR